MPFPLSFIIFVCFVSIVLLSLTYICVVLCSTQKRREVLVFADIIVEGKREWWQIRNQLNREMMVQRCFESIFRKKRCSLRFTWRLFFLFDLLLPSRLTFPVIVCLRFLFPLPLCYIHSLTHRMEGSIPLLDTMDHFCAISRSSGFFFLENARRVDASSFHTRIFQR